MHTGDLVREVSKRTSLNGYGCAIVQSDRPMYPTHHDVVIQLRGGDTSMSRDSGTGSIDSASHLERRPRLFPDWHAAPVFCWRCRRGVMAGWSPVGSASHAGHSRC